MVQGKILRPGYFSDSYDKLTQKGLNRCIALLDWMQGQRIVQQA